MAAPRVRWVVGVAVVGLAVALGAAGLLWLVTARMVSQARHEMLAQSAELAMEQLSLAVDAYADRHGGMLPPAEDWVEVLRPWTADDIDDLLRSPLQERAQRAYAMNRALGGRHLADVAAPTRTVLFFEIEPGDPPSGGPELLPARPRSTFGFVIVFADGHVELVGRSRVGRLIWQ